jgi:hypothetical protein
MILHGLVRSFANGRPGRIFATFQIGFKSRCKALFAYFLFRNHSAQPRHVETVANKRSLWHARPQFERRCRSSVVEHSLGKGEVESSILSGSTIDF